MLIVKCGQLLCGEEWKADLLRIYSPENVFADGSVIAGCYCSVRVRTQKGVPALPQLTSVNVLDATKLSAVITILTVKVHDARTKPVYDN